MMCDITIALIPCMLLLQATVDSPTWRLYIEYLDDIVLEGLFNCINCSLQYLMRNTDKNQGELPALLMCKMELQAPEIVFMPTLDQEDPKGFYMLVEGGFVRDESDIFAYSGLQSAVVMCHYTSSLFLHQDCWMISFDLDLWYHVWPLMVTSQTISVMWRKLTTYLNNVKRSCKECLLLSARLL